MANNNSDNDSLLLSQIINQGVNIYGSREKIREALIAYAKSYLNLGDLEIGKTSYLAYLVDMLSILSANHLFYDATIYREFFFTDAQMSESVNNLAKWIGYTVPKAVPAQVNMMFEIPLNFNNVARNRITFNLSPYFYVRTENIPFIIKSASLNAVYASSASIANQRYWNQTTDRQKKLQAMLGSVVNNSAFSIRDSEGIYRPVYLDKKGSSAFFTLPFVQKEILLKIFNVPNDLAINQFYSVPITFDGQVCDIEVFVVSPTANQRLSISGTTIDGVLDAANFDPYNDDDFIDSAGNACKWVQWQESVNGIYTMSSRATQFSWIGGYNKGELLFGNGILGKQPPAGSIIAVRLHVTKGSQGNVIADTITTGDPIYTSNKYSNNMSLNYIIRNPKAAYGGSDLLTLPEIKQNAITNLAAKKRLVSEWDYDNIKNIAADDLPLKDSYSILKRSDIKVNEIDVFTTLEYVTDEVNEIVPTRNVYIELDNPKWDDNGKYTIFRDYEITYPKRNGDKYLTMFNMTLDKNTMLARYDYILQNINGSVVKMYAKTQDNYWDKYVYMTANGCNFGIDINKKALLGNVYPLNITFNLNHVESPILRSHSDAIQEGNNSTFTFKMLAESAGSSGITEDFDGDYTDLLSITKFRALMTTKWDKFNTYQPDSSSGYRADTTVTVVDTDTQGTDEYIKTKYNSFSWRLHDYTEVPEGTQRFEFQIQALVPRMDSDRNIYDINGNVVITGKGGVVEENVEVPIKFVWTTINTYYCDVVVRRNLDNFMSSALTVDDDTGIYKVHNVPVILKDYYDNIINSDKNDKDTNNFEINVMQSLISNINLTNTKMLTDFVNLKFADTYGSMINLRYNKPDYIVESRYWNTPWWERSGQSQDTDDLNPDYDTETQYLDDDHTKINPYYIAPDANDVYYIVNGVIEGQRKPLSDYIGWIALRVPTKIDEEHYSYTYNLYEPEVGDYVRVKDELDNEGYHKTLVWTGKEWKDVTQYQIPLNLKLKIEVDESSVSTSDDDLKERIIDALTTYFSNKMGIQRNLDRSEVIKVCRSVKGVIYAELIDPAVDIRFNYVMQDLSQKQLLDFTPQYIGFRGKTDSESDYSRSTIDIKIVRR